MDISLIDNSNEEIALSWEIDRSSIDIDILAQPPGEDLIHQGSKLAEAHDSPDVVYHVILSITTSSEEGANLIRSYHCSVDIDETSEVLDKLLHTMNHRQSIVME